MDLRRGSQVRSYWSHGIYSFSVCSATFSEPLWSRTHVIAVACEVVFISILPRHSLSVSAAKGIFFRL